MSHIKINRIPVAEAQRIVDFVNSDFVKVFYSFCFIKFLRLLIVHCYLLQTEPLCEYLGSFVSSFNDVIILRTVQLGFSVEAIDTRSNKRIGVFLTAPVKKNVKSALEQELEKLEMDEKMGKIGDILDYAKSMVEPLIHSKYNQDQYLDGVIMSVLSEYGGQGIGKKLLNAVEGVARELKLHLIYVGCSSEYSAKVVAKCGFQEIYSLRYDEYLKDGRPVFLPKAPHDTLRAYIKLLE